MGPTTHIHWRPVLLVWLMLLVLGFGIMVAIAPQTRIYEDIICRRYYADGPEQSITLGIAFLPDDGPRHQGPDEKACKDPVIQDALNQLFGWQTFFDGIPGLLLAMYYGSLADSWGRRPILVLSLVGQLLGALWILFICWIEADVKLTWLSSIFSCIGGGNTVFTAAAMMIIADATPDASRTRVFFYASTCLIVGEMLGPPVGAALMAHDPWIPNILGFLCMGIATIFAFLMPETLGKASGSDTEGNPATWDNEQATSNGLPLKAAVQHALTTLRFIFQDRNLALLVAAYFTVDFARETLGLLVRYVSARFSIPLAQASYLLSFRASGQLLATALLLPLFDALLAKRFKSSPQRKDLFMARISIVFVTLGFATLIIAPGMAVIYAGIALYTCGTGFQASTKALLGSMVDRTLLGTVFTTLSLMDTVGALFAGPIDALLMKHSLRMEGIWQSLPFMFAFLCCALATVSLGYVKLRRGDVSLEDAGDEERRVFLAGQESEREDDRVVG
ncbi:hypothetical protein VTK26DRAFT_5927 [Humicola hyalothermophila]